MLSRLGGLRESRTALATELRRRVGLCTAGDTDRSRSGQPTDAIPARVHISIVSLLVGDVRQIAVPLRHEVLRPSFVVAFETRSDARRVIAASDAPGGPSVVALGGHAGPV